MEELKKLIDDLRVLIEQRFADIESLITSKAKVKSPIKKKRKPNKYALYMKECLSGLKNEPGTQPEKFIRCGDKYKELKKQGRI